MKISMPGKRILCLFAAALPLLIFWGRSSGRAPRTAAVPFPDPRGEIIVIDAGHGGIDGGANRDGLLEKEINLDIAKKLSATLAQKGYRIVMTRDADISLDDLDDSGKSRHKRDLNARVRIINSSDAALFISVHVNCSASSAATSGSIVFYDGRDNRSEMLACCIQENLNAITVNGQPRRAHEPQRGDYFILKNADIPGVIVETAFISNQSERKLLADDDFRVRLASAIADGTVRYLTDPVAAAG